MAAHQHGNNQTPIFRSRPTTSRGECIPAFAMPDKVLVHKAGLHGPPRPELIAGIHVRRPDPNPGRAIWRAKEIWNRVGTDKRAGGIGIRISDLILMKPYLNSRVEARRRNTP